MPVFGQWKFSNDLKATEAAYRLVKQSGAEECGCGTCRNYVKIRDRVLPAEFISFVSSLGIDPLKEAEAYHIAPTSPGKHHYGGWFHFVGDLIDTGHFPMVNMSPSFKVWLCRSHAPHLNALDELPLVQVEFHAENVPWALDDPEPT